MPQTPSASRRILALLTLLGLSLFAFNPSGFASSKNMYTAKTGSGEVKVYRGDKKLWTFKTSSPNVKGYRFIQDWKFIAIKSNGKGKPSVVELFDNRNGKRVEKLYTDKLKKNAPNWAVWAR